MRDRKNPLVIVPLDVINRLNKEVLSGKLKEADLESRRETPVAEAFEKIVKDYGPNTKGLVYFHLFHLIRGWRTSVPLTWLDRFEQKNPALAKNVRLVVFDEMEPSWAPQGTFQLAQRLAHLAKAKPYGVRLAPFSEVARETGKNVFESDVMFPDVSSPQSGSRLDEMADWLIWFPPAKDKDYRRLER